MIKIKNIVVAFLLICSAGCNEDRNHPKIIFCDMIYSGRDHFYVTKQNYTDQSYYFTTHQLISTIEETATGRLRINAQVAVGNSHFESFIVLFDVENNKIRVFWNSDNHRNEELNLINENSSVILCRKDDKYCALSGRLVFDNKDSNGCVIDEMRFYLNNSKNETE